MTEKKQLKANRRNVKLSVAKEDELKVKAISKDFSSANNCVPDHQLLKEYSNLDFNSKRLTPSQEKRKEELKVELGMLYGLENGIWTANLSYGKYYAALGKMRQNIVRQYNCRGSLELMLADRIVASYWRAMRYDRMFNYSVEKENGGFSFDQLKVNVLKEFNKGLELADRQLNTNIILLKELKQPKLNIKVRTDSAYIAQNQQLNINPPNKDNPNKNENIEPK